MKTIKKEKLISIITPNYNGGKYLEESIKSVITQSNNNFEYLIFDGASTDNSLDIINKYDSKIHYVSIKRDKGMYHAVDKAIRFAKGEIIIWINSDDILDKDAVLNVTKIFKNNNIDWITGINGYIKKNIKISGIPYLYPRLIISNKCAHHNYWGFIQQESVVFTKKLFIKSGGFKDFSNNASDFHLWKTFSNFSKLKSYFIKIGYFRTWPGQNSQLQTKKYYKDTGSRKFFFSFRFFRLIISLMFLPYIYLKTQYILSKHKLKK